ncbi:MAG: complex I subunit 5 family protein [Clostridia bacterium]
MILTVITPIIVASLIGVFYNKRKGFWLTLASIAFLLNIAFCLYFLLHNSLPIIYNLGQWGERLGIVLIFSQVTVTLNLVWNFLFLAILCYCHGENKNNDYKFYMLIMVMLFAISGWTVTDDLYNMFVFIEIVSIISYALVAYRRSKESLEASLKYLFTGAISSILVLLAILIIHFSTGELNIGLAMGKFSKVDLTVQFITWGMLLTGFLSKAGSAPMHFWLPDAHASAMTGVSALLSGIVIKLSIVSLYKLMDASSFIPKLDQTITTITFIIGGLSIVLGHLVAYRQTSIKRLLAYSSIAQIGYIIMGLSYSVSSKAGALFHTLNHAMLKSALFFSAGILVKYKNSLEIEDMRGTGRKNPFASAIFTIAALGIIGIPPLNGFSSKWALMKGLLAEQFILISFLIPLGTILAVLYYVKILIVIFDKKTKLPDIRFSRLKAITLSLILFGIISTSIFAPLILSLFGA